MLRNGPARTMIDKLLRAAAEATGTEFMVLGIRYGDYYEFISTHGVPLSSFVERTPAGRLKKSLFAREVEVEDLQAEPNWATLNIVPIAQHWRYGANAPVRLVQQLPDEGVLALSCADRSSRPKGGRTLETLRRYAEFISDCIWLVTQIRAVTIKTDAFKAAAKIILDGIQGAKVAVALVDEQLNILGCSRVFSDTQLERLGIAAEPGQSMADQWLDPQSLAAVRESLRSGKPVIRRDTLPNGADETTTFDFHTMKYDNIPARFGVFGLYVQLPGAELVGGSAGPLPKRPNEVSSDGVGAVMRFLDETLPHKQRLLKRDKRSYVAVRTWRKSIKPYQISALKALKEAPPQQFVDRIAQEIAASITAIHGRVDQFVVVPMPCGHSGPGCLSARLGDAIAALLNIECVHAFETICVTGSSHPKSNVRRPPMKLLVPVEAPVLLIDDVATSGAHVVEASKLLLKSASSVLPVVWIAD